MKKQLRILFSPLLKKLEAGNESYAYKPSHRIILLFMSSVFSGLSIAVTIVEQTGSLSYLIPVIVFGALGAVGLIVGLIGNDRAVAKIWGQ